MDNDKIIKVEFAKQSRNIGALQFSNNTIQADAKVYGYYLYNLTEELSSYFWNNQQFATKELDQSHANEFDYMIRQIKLSINSYLNYLYNTNNNKETYKALKNIFDIDIKIIKDWFVQIGIPFKQANVIDIKSYIGAK